MSRPVENHGSGDWRFAGAQHRGDSADQLLAAVRTRVSEKGRWDADVILLHQIGRERTWDRPSCHPVRLAAIADNMRQGADWGIRILPENVTGLTGAIGRILSYRLSLEVRTKLLPQAPRQTPRANGRPRGRPAGAGAGLLFGLAALAIPGVGPFITAGGVGFCSWDDRWGIGRRRDRGWYLGCYRRRVKPSGV
jgi:hypothetical protein